MPDESESGRMAATGQSRDHTWCGTCASILNNLESELLASDPSTPMGLQSLLAHTVEHAMDAGQIPRTAHGELIVAVSTTSEGGISLVIQEDPPVPAAVRRQAELAFSRVTKAPKAQSFSLYLLRY